ncbi:MAG: ATPase, partial [Firmicutes bacterium]|nr:ATPase [Bacillota bacterium]
HEITRQAYQQSAEIIEAAKKQAKEMRIGAMEYADEVLSQSENRLREMIESFRNECVSVDEYFNNSLNTLYENRQELRGINGR